MNPIIEGHGLKRYYLNAEQGANRIIILISFS